MATGRYLQQERAEVWRWLEWSKPASARVQEQLAQPSHKHARKQPLPLLSSPNKATHSLRGAARGAVIATQHTRAEQPCAAHPVHCGKWRPSAAALPLAIASAGLPAVRAAVSAALATALPAARKVSVPTPHAALKAQCGHGSKRHASEAVAAMHAAVSSAARKCTAAAHAAVVHTAIAAAHAAAMRTAVWCVQPAAPYAAVGAPKLAAAVHAALSGSQRLPATYRPLLEHCRARSGRHGW